MSAAIAWAALAGALLSIGTPTPARPAAPADTRPQVRPTGSVTGLGATIGAVLVCTTIGFAVGGTIAAVAALLVTPVVGYRLTRRSGRAAARLDPSLPLAIDLVAAALNAGQPLSRALELAAGALDTAGAQELVGIARLLALGAAPDDAWRNVNPHLEALGAAARRSERSGARLAGTCTDLAADMRSAGRAAALARADRAGVLALLPLGLCFLPAFVCLGIVPSVAGLLAGVMTGGP